MTAREPRRTCVGCGRTATQRELERLARRPDGTVGVGRSEPGRGAYVCLGSASCFDAAVRRGALSRALRTEITGEAERVLRARLFERESC